MIHPSDIQGFILKKKLRMVKVQNKESRNVVGKLKEKGTFLETKVRLEDNSITDLTETM
jgi:hypothetical protein